MTTTSNVYEIFNDFLAFRDPTQIMGLATNLELFASASLSDGKVYIGENAPEAFREAMRRHADAKKSSVKLGAIKSKVGNDITAIFISEIKGKKDSKSSAFTISMRSEQLIGFMEFPSA